MSRVGDVAILVFGGGCSLCGEKQNLIMGSEIILSKYVGYTRKIIDIVQHDDAGLAQGTAGR